MFNVTNALLMLSQGRGEGLILNKGSYNRHFIYLLTLLTLWLLSYTLVPPMFSSGRMALLMVVLTARVFLAIKTKSLLLFYIFFELRVIPITLIVFLFGYQPEKLQAAVALLLYTVVSSLPLLLFIIYCDITFIISSVLALPMTIGFMVKTPMYLFHTWLPKAHVEAPVGGSMFLAGVLLKLGSYGLILFLPFVQQNTLTIFYMSMALVGSPIACLICLRQGDLKILIAYSSVVHIGVVTLGFIRGREIGYTCALIMVFSHGLRSPFLFAFSYWQYVASHSRLIINNLSTWPISIFGFICLVSLNMGVPPSLSVWSEVLLARSLLFLIAWALPIFILILFLGGLYNLYLYVSCMHCKFSLENKTIDTANVYPLAQVIFYGYSSFLCLDYFHL